MVGDDRSGVGAAEMSVGLVAPVHVYALFESVIAHRARRRPAEHRTALGELMAPFTAVAATHPMAWFPEVRTPSELATVTPDNRLVAEPYPKRMCAFLNVNQGAAVLVTSLAAARAAGVADRAVFCWSGADATEVWFPSARPDLGSSAGLRAATSGAAAAAAGIGVDDIGVFDLYSCFPCAVEMAAEALGIAADDARGLTVTGGLPYFGGPGNNYSLHAVATMVDRLREQGGTGARERHGLVRHQARRGHLRRRPPAPGLAPGRDRRGPAGHRRVGRRGGDRGRRPRRGGGGHGVTGPDGAVSAAPVIAAPPRRAPGRRRGRAGRARGTGRARPRGRSHVEVSGSPPRTGWRLIPVTALGWRGRADPARLGRTEGKEHRCPQSNASAEDTSRSSPSTGPRRATPSTARSAWDGERPRRARG